MRGKNGKKSHFWAILTDLTSQKMDLTLDLALMLQNMIIVSGKGNNSEVASKMELLLRRN